MKLSLFGGYCVLNFARFVPQYWLHVGRVLEITIVCPSMVPGMIELEVVSNHHTGKKKKRTISPVKILDKALNLWACTVGAQNNYVPASCGSLFEVGYTRNLELKNMFIDIGPRYP